MVEAAARKLGLRVYPSSCSANIDSHGLACYACRWGPCGGAARLPEVEPEAIEELAGHLGIELKSVRVSRSYVRVEYKGRPQTGPTRKNQGSS